MVFSFISKCKIKKVRMLSFFLFLLIINFILVFFYKTFSKIININDIPDKTRKIHKKITPLYGGIIVLVNFLIFSFFNLLNEYINLKQTIFFFLNNYQFLVFFFTGLMFFVIGLYDDKNDLAPNLKILFMIIILLIFLFLDNNLLITEIRLSFTGVVISLGSFSYFFTIFCFLLFINACNMFDGINLQSSSFFFIFTLGLLIFIEFNSFHVFIFMSLIAIMILNINGKIFIGDSGILLISFILGYTAIKLYNLNLIPNSDSIFILMMVPGYDLLRLFIERIIKRKHPFLPDQLHLHHLLLKKHGYLIAQLIIFLIISFPIILMALKVNLLLIIIISTFVYIATLVTVKKHNK